MHNVVNMRENYWQRQGLWELIQYINTGLNVSQSNLLEIGCYQGESSEIFARYFQSITCVDLWASDPTYMDDATGEFDMSLVEANFDERMARFNNVVKIKRNFQGLLIEHPYDVVYLDANHEYDNVLKDINQILSYEWKPKVIAGHDYTSGWPGVIQVVNEKFNTPDKVFSDNSWVVFL